MEGKQNSRKFPALAGLMAGIMAGAVTPAMAAGSATLQGDPIAVAVGTVQFGVSDSGNSLSAPMSAHSENGGFVTAWTNSIADNSASNVYAHRFNADGSPAGGDVLVNQAYAGQGSWIKNQSPEIAVDGSGNFVVAWKIVALDGQSAVEKARVFNADGSARTDEFCVDPACAPIPPFTGHVVAMQINGAFTVAYVGSPVNQLTPLYFRQYAQDGTPLQTQASEAYNDVGSFSMALVRGSGQLSFVAYINDGGTSGGAGYGFSNAHLVRYYANGKPLGFPVTLGACSGIFYLGVGYGCQIDHADLGTDASGNVTVSWRKTNVFGTSLKSQTYLRHYFANGFANGGKIAVDPASMLANGFVAENGAGDLIATGPTGLDGLQVFDNKGTALGDVVAAPVGFNINADTSGNFVATNVMTTYPPNSNQTTVTVQRYSVP